MMASGFAVQARSALENRWCRETWLQLQTDEVTVKTSMTTDGHWWINGCVKHFSIKFNARFGDLEHFPVHFGDEQQYSNSISWSKRAAGTRRCGVREWARCFTAYNFGTQYIMLINLKSVVSSPQSCDNCMTYLTIMYCDGLILVTGRHSIRYHF